MFEFRSPEDMQLLAGFRFVREVFLEVYYGHHSGVRVLARNPSVEWLAELLHYNNIGKGVSSLYTNLSALNVTEANGNVSVVIEVRGKTHSLAERNIGSDVTDCLSENVRKAIGMYPLGSPKTLFGNFVEHLKALKELKRKANAWEASLWLVLLMSITMGVVTNRNLGKDDRSNMVNNNTWWQAFYEMRKKPSRATDAIRVKDNYQIEERPLNEIYQDARFMFNEGIVQLMINSASDFVGGSSVVEEGLFMEESIEPELPASYSRQDVEMVIPEPVSSDVQPQEQSESPFLGENVTSLETVEQVEMIPEFQNMLDELENLPKEVLETVALLETENAPLASQEPVSPEQPQPPITER
jgi:hypothetical protein